jgi:hypothetical protein
VGPFPVTLLRRGKANPRLGNQYACMMHPDRQALAEAVGGAGMGEPGSSSATRPTCSSASTRSAGSPLLGWAIYRQEAIEILRCTSSLQGLA